MDTSSAFYSSLLGPVSEPSLTIAVDTSASMYQALGHVRNRLQQWLEACSRAPFSPPRLNLLAFDTVAKGWQRRAVELTFERLQSAISWVKGLRCTATSNLADGLATALSDKSSQAVYLVTDGCTSDWGSRELLRRLSTWNSSLQPIHVVLVGSDVDTEAVHRIAATWRSQSNSQESTQRVLDFYTELARRSLGSLRRVRLPDPRQHRQQPTPTAEMLIDFRRVVSPSASPTGRYLLGRPTTPQTTKANGAMTGQLSPLHTEEAAASFRATSSASTTAAATADSFQLTDSPPHRHVAADFIRGLRVLAKSDENGLYCLGHVQEQIGADRFIVRFDEDDILKQRSLPKHMAKDQVTALDDLLSFNDARRLPVSITDRVLVPHSKLPTRFVPATVLRQTDEAASGVKFLVAQHYGELSIVEAHRIIHISASRYERAVEAMLDRKHSSLQNTWNHPNQEASIMPKSQTTSKDSRSHYAPADQDFSHNSMRSQDKPAPENGTASSPVTAPNFDLTQEHADAGAFEEANSWEHTLSTNGSSLIENSGNFIDHDPDWPEPAPDPGRLLNVSAEYQAGFAAGFAAAQKTHKIVQAQETVTPTLTRSAERNLSSVADGRKHADARMVESHAQRWQYWGNRPSTAPARTTLQDTPGNIDTIPKLAGHGRLFTTPPHLKSSVQLHHSDNLTSTPKPLHPTFLRQQEQREEEQGNKSTTSRHHRQQYEAHFQEKQQLLRDKEAQRMALKRAQHDQRTLNIQEKQNRDEKARQRAPFRHLAPPKGSVEKEEEVEALEALKIAHRQQQADLREEHRTAANREQKQRQQLLQDGRKQRASQRQEHFNQRLQEERLSAQKRHQLNIRNASVRRQKEIAMEEREQQQRDTKDFLHKRTMQQWANQTQY